MANTTADPLSVHNPGVIIHSRLITSLRLRLLISFGLWNHMRRFQALSAGFHQWPEYYLVISGIYTPSTDKTLDLAQILMERAAAIRFSQRLIRRVTSQLVKMGGFMLCGEPDWKVVWTGKSKARKYISCIRRTKSKRNYNEDFRQVNGSNQRSHLDYLLSKNSSDYSAHWSHLRETVTVRTKHKPGVVVKLERKAQSILQFYGALRTCWKDSIYELNGHESQHKFVKLKKWKTFFPQPRVSKLGLCRWKIRQTQVLIDCKFVQMNEIIFISNKTT